jgi:acyl carrier protein
VVRADTDLQGELGIDSIKKVEILGMFQRAYGFGSAERPSAMESLSQARTPREAVDVLHGLLSGSAAPTGNGTAADATARFVPVAEGAP